MADDPDPAYPPEFEALDCAFNAALNVAEGDVALAHRLYKVLSNMELVASAVHTKAEYDAKVAERGVE